MKVGIGAVMWSVILAIPPTPATALENPLALMRTTLGTDMDAPPDQDDPGTGGSFDNLSTFENKLADEKAIGNCIDQIENSADDWARSVGLTRNFRERQTASLSLHYGMPMLPGIFVLSYSVAERIRAAVRVDFFRLDGSKQAPEAAKPLLTTYKIGSLQSALDKALLCTAKP